jgi:transmembrane sensor
MDELILRSLQGRTTETEEQNLFEWRRASDANEQTYRELERLWSVSAQLPRAGANEPAPTIQDLLEKRRARSVVIGLPSSGPRARRGWRFWSAIGTSAAAVVVLLLAGRHFWPSANAAGPAEIVTGASELSTVTLGDGSVVRLAPSSRLRLPHGLHAREVWLEGRAYFAVAHDPKRRFKVHTNLGDAVVLGTRFDLRTDGSQLRLLVVEGRVQLETSGHTVAVGAHRLAQVASAQEPAVAEVDQQYIQRTLDWTGNFVAFETTPLRDVARELGQHYSIAITVTDSTLAKKTVTGWFANESLEDVLMLVCRAVRARCAVLESGVTIGL